MISTKGRRSGAGSVRALAVKMNQVARQRLGVQLSQQRGDLAAMIGTVIHHMLHGLPQGIRVCTKIQGTVLVDSI